MSYAGSLYVTLLLSILVLHSLYYSQRMWIGLTDGILEGEFRWVDTSLAIYTRWWPGEPSNHFGMEHCATMESYGWVDLSCADEKPYLCQSKTGMCV